MRQHYRVQAKQQNKPITITITSTTNMAEISSTDFLKWYRDGTQPLHFQPALNSILNWSDTQLERVHNYIQWVFPLPEQSYFAFAAPVIDAQVFAAFRTDRDLQGQLQRAYERIIRFYGFALTDGGQLHVAFSSPSQQHWVCRMDHNHLRITRILRSLRVLGLDAQAKHFYAGLLDVVDRFKGRVGPRSVMYWTRALQRPLYMAPDSEAEDDGAGQDFLVEWESRNNPMCRAAISRGGEEGRR